jgi:hypothetical protein
MCGNFISIKDIQFINIFFTFHKKEYFQWIYFEIDLEWSKSLFDVEQQPLRFDLGGVLCKHNPLV